MEKVSIYTLLEVHTRDDFYMNQTSSRYAILCLTCIPESMRAEEYNLAVLDTCPGLIPFSADDDIRQMFPDTVAEFLVQSQALTKRESW